MTQAMRSRGILLAGGLSLVLALLPATAQAAVPGEPSDIADVLEDAETAAVGTPTPSDVGLPMLQADGPDTSVALNGIDSEVTLGGSEGAEISEADQYAIAEGDSVTYAVSFPEEGATRFSAILSAPPEEYPEWTFESGTQLLLLGDGSVSVSDADGFVGGVEAPWAIDAAGQPLPTHYEISGSTLTQIVDTTGATFPVVADPTVQFFGPYIQVHLNKAESRLAVGGYAACAGVLSKSPVPFAKLLQVACTTVAAIGATQLVGNRCISIHYVVGVGGPAGVWWPWVRNC
ncbi:hypothetical protein ACFVWL_08160 [Microbacterium sp. NPDC058269]|uniref:hypothetical protein n=1 Tax=Microbacterium sp. NPDC058269 TaxID=3346414 RepID=UPI0036DF2BF0